jgi:hypothetical protein
MVTIPIRRTLLIFFDYLPVCLKSIIVVSICISEHLSDPWQHSILHFPVGKIVVAGVTVDFPAQTYEHFNIGMADNTLALEFANLNVFPCQGQAAGAETHQDADSQHVAPVRYHALLFWRVD